MTVLENVTLAPRKVLGLLEGRRRDARRDARSSNASGSWDKAQRVSRPALGRPAAAGRDRAGAGDAARAHAARRDHQRARPRARRRGAQHRARARGRGHDDAARDPRDGLRARGREPRSASSTRASSPRRARPSRSSAEPETPATCRASFAASSRPAASNSLAGLRKLLPARLASLGNRFFVGTRRRTAPPHSSVQVPSPASARFASSARFARQSVLRAARGACAAIPLRPGRGPSPIPGNGSGSMRARPRAPAHLVTDLLSTQSPMASHLRARHVGAAGGSQALGPVRRARRGAAARRAHRARGEAQPSRARLGGPPGAAHARGACGSSTVRSPTPLPVNEHGGTLPRRAQPPGHRRPARRRCAADNNDHRILAVAQQPGRRGPRRHGRHQGPAAAAEGQHRRPRRRRVPQRAGDATRPGPASSSSTSTAA